MARIKPSILINQIAGSYQALTFQRSRNGLLLKAKQNPSKRYSYDGNNINQRRRSVYTAWRDLTENERTIWKQFVFEFHKQDTFGREYIMSAFQLFMSQNTIRVNNNLPILTTPEPYQVPQVITIGNVIAQQSNPSTMFFSIQISWSGELPWSLSVDIFGPASAGIQNPVLINQINFRNTSFTANGSSTLSGFESVTAVNYLNRQGDKVWFRLKGRSNFGAQNFPILFAETIIQ